MIPANSRSFDFTKGLASESLPSAQDDNGELDHRPQQRSLLFRSYRPHLSLHAGAGGRVYRSGMVALWLAHRSRVRLRRVVAYLNFYWLKQVVTALADRATQSGQAHSSRGVVLRFLLRYVLMALGAYVIFTVSPASLYGLFAGLFLPVAAIACEAAYETWVALSADRLLATSFWPLA